MSRAERVFDAREGTDGASDAVGDRGDVARAPTRSSDGATTSLSHQHHHHESASSFSGALTPTPSFADDVGTFNEKFQSYMRSLTPIEYSCVKATMHSSEGRAPKRRHVERLVRATWCEDATRRSENIEMMLKSLARVDVLRSSVSALRMCGVVHALQQHGSSSILHPTYAWREKLMDEPLEAYSSDFGALGGARRKASAEFTKGLGFYEREGFDACAGLVAPYAAMIRAKSKFHRFFVAFENNYSVDARVETLEDDDIGMHDPISSVSLCALIAVAGKARRVVELAARHLPEAVAATTNEFDKLQWTDLIGFVARLALREADLAYAAALFVAATLAEENRLSEGDNEKFRAEHVALRECFRVALRKAFLRQEIVHTLGETEPKFLEKETDIKEILSANAPAKKHVLDPTFENLMDADLAAQAPQIIAVGEIPPLIKFDDNDDNEHYNPFGLAPPLDLGARPGHRRKPSDFDLDAFAAPLEFTPLQSGPASASTYVDPFAVRTLTDALDESESKRSPQSTPSPLAPQKPPRSPMTTPSSRQNDFEEIPLDHLEFGRQIGRGAFGEVFRGKYRGTDVAIKRLCVLNDVSDERGLAEFKRELSFLTRLRHRHIVQFIGASTAPPNLCIIMDYCDKGSLYAYLHNPNKTLSAFKVLKWMSEAAKGLVYLHASDIIHRDVKSGNLFIDDGGSIKLGDFGLSKFHTGASTSGGMMSLVGTYQFMAPELLEGQPRYTTAVDVYSFAVVMWECLTREDPFSGLSPMQIVAALLRGERPSLDDASKFAVRLPEEYIAVIARCWRADALERPTMEDIAPELERMFFAEKRLVIESKKRAVEAAPSLMP